MVRRLGLEHAFARKAAPAFRKHALGAALVLALAVPVAAQEPAQSPFSGFSPDSGKPIDITSQNLEIRQKDNQAIFSGDVVAVQGESRLTADRLIVFYNAAEGEEGLPSGSGGVRRLEAEGNVIVSSKDQKATGDRGEFEMESNIARLIGNVVLTQGKSVIRGPELVVDMKSGVARIVGGTSGLFIPNAGAAREAPAQ